MQPSGIVSQSALANVKNSLTYNELADFLTIRRKHAVPEMTLKIFEGNFL